MLLFTAKSRHLLNSAIQDLPDEAGRQLWREWARDNPQLRRPGGIVDDGTPPPSKYLIEVMLSSLRQLEAHKRRVDWTTLSEDERSDLESDLTYIIALSQFLNQMPTT